MRISRLRAVALSAVTLSLLATGGCARTNNRADLPYVARDVGTLYSAARARLDRGDYKVAAALFDEVERQHPYSIWARRAQLMGAFSYYLNKDYTQAIQSAQRFLSVHPGNRDAPYAYYLVALSYYEQISDVTRDQKITQQALDALGELSRRYPNTRYAADARLKVDLVRDHLAGKEMEIGRFYERRGQWLAASMRFRSVVDQYQTTTHTPEALMRLVETYLSLGLREEAKKSAAVLGANYPGTDWYKRAYELAGEHPILPPQAQPPLQAQTVAPPKAPGAPAEGSEPPAPPANPTDTPGTVEPGPVPTTPTTTPTN
jgi:outer membrane protein assembly factor BamD